MISGLDPVETANLLGAADVAIMRSVVSAQILLIERKLVPSTAPAHVDNLLVKVSNRLPNGSSERFVSSLTNKARLVIYCVQNQRTCIKNAGSRNRLTVRTTEDLVP